MTDLTETAREFAHRLDHQTAMLIQAKESLKVAMKTKDRDQVRFWEHQEAQAHAIYRELETLAASLHILPQVIDMQNANARQRNND